MRLTDEDIREFREIYEREFNEPISGADARLMAERVMELCELLARPLPCEVDGLANCPKCSMVNPSPPARPS